MIYNPIIILHKLKITFCPSITSRNTEFKISLLITSNNFGRTSLLSKIFHNIWKSMIISLLHLT
jgi:hypothetical protein